MSKHWFVPKMFGWGFVPVSLAGWLMTLVLIGLLLISAYLNNIWQETASLRDAGRFLIDLILLISAFSYFAEKKTKGELKWRWGKE